MRDPVPALTVALEAAAVVTSALSGMVSAARHRMDVVGTFWLATVTAFGGGTIRDILLGRRPFFWVANEEYLLVLLLLCLAFVYSRKVYALARLVDRRAVVIDALGLALFSLTGVRFAREAGLPILSSSLIGTVTGTFGGVLRDVFVQEVPAIFRPGSLYAIPALLGCWVWLAADALGVPTGVGEAVAFVAIVGLRLSSVRWGVRVRDPHWLRGAAPPAGEAAPPEREGEGPSPT